MGLFSLPVMSQGDPYSIVLPSNPCSGDVISFEFLDEGNADSAHWVLNGNPMLSKTMITETVILPRGTHIISNTVYYNDSIGKHYAVMTVNGFPTRFLPGDNSEFCPGEEVQFKVNPLDLSGIRWTVNGNYSSQTDFTYIFPNEGTYIVSLEGQSPSCGAVLDTLQQLITIKKRAKANAKPALLSEGQFCPMDKVFFEHNGNLQNEIWDFGDGATIQGYRNPGHIYKNPGKYTVTLTAENFCGGSGKDSMEVIINNNAPAYADFTFSPDREDYCPYEPIKFYAKGSGKYIWDFDDGGVSTQAFPTHVFGDSLKVWNVKLQVTNSCGNKASTTIPVSISNSYYSEASVVPYFDISDADPDNPIYYICNAKTIKLNAFEPEHENLTYQWIIENQNTFEIDTVAGKSISYPFELYPYNIQLVAKNLCGNETSESRSLALMVNTEIQPYLMPGIFPQRICPGERVYFWDDALTLDSPTLPYRYSIYFGEGTPAINFRNFENFEEGILRSHTYSDIQEYNFSMFALNECDNSSDTTFGIIQVRDDLPTEVMIHNSTRDWDEDNNILKPMEDWSKRINSTDRILRVNSMLYFMNGINNSYYYMIYEGGIFGIPDRMPDAYVKSIPVNLYSYDTVSIYIPEYINSVGVAVGWYCDSLHQMKKLPDQMIIPNNMYTGLIYNIDLDQDSIDYANPDSFYVYLEDACPPTNTAELVGLWRNKDGDTYTFLMFSETLEYEIYSSKNPTGIEKEMISQGTYSPTSAEFTLYDNTLCFGLDGIHMYNLVVDTLMLMSPSDGCFERSSAIEYRNFERIPQTPAEYAVCPGDTVRFSIYGGDSYLWDFGDGQTSTQPFPAHVYDSSGIYYATCAVSNNCLRTDTFHTIVIVSEGVLPLLSFDADNWFPKEDENVKFYYDNDYQDNRFKDYAFHWDFGDGLSSSAKYPVHQYTNPGVYNVRLSVSNSCGTVMSDPKPIIVNKECDVYPQFKLVADTANPNKIYYYNTSIGDITNAGFWKFDDGNIIPRKPGIYYKILENGPHTACLWVVKSDTSCTDYLCKDFIVGMVECNADFTYDINSTLNEVFFTNTSINTTNYYWEFGDGTTSILQNPTKKYKTPGYYHVVLTASNTSCTSIKDEWIQVGEDVSSCVADFWYTLDANDSTIVHFHNSSITQGQIVKGYYDFGDGSFAYEADPTHKYSAPGIYKVCAGFTDNNGCQARICKPVNAGNEDCYADFFVIHSRVNSSATFVADSIGEAEFFWDFGDGSTAEGRIASHLYSEPGYYPVCLNVVNASVNCFVEMCKDVQISGDTSVSLCHVNLSYTIDPATRTVNFSSNSGASFTNWLWDFGDGTISTAKDTSHQYAADGVYPVCLYAYDDITGCFDDDCKSIVITGLNTGEQLTADFSAINIPGTMRVKYKNRSQGNITNKYWTFGDGTFDLGLTGDTVSHIFPDYGLWNSCLIVANSSTFNANRKCKRVFVGDASICRLNADFSMMVIPDDLSVNFIDKSTGGAYRWFWNFGDGNSSNRRKPSHTYEKPGLYLVTLSVQDTTGNCIDNASKFVQVGQSDCMARFEYSVNTSTYSVRFKNISRGNITGYQWDFGDGGSSTLPAPLHIFTPGNYTVSLTISSDAGCVDQYFENIQVGLIPCDASFTVHVDTTNRAFFNNKVLGGVNKLLWIFGDGAVSEKNDPVHKYNFPGIYTVGLYAYTGTCTDYSEETIIVGARDGDMQAFFTQTVDENNLTVKFFDRSIGTDGSTTYLWDFGDTTTSTDQNPVKTYTEGGYYFVCLTVIGQDGMQNTTCKMVKVAPPASKDCLADFFYTVDSAALSGTFTSASYGVTPTTTYRWIFGDEILDGNSSESFSFDSAGFYNVGLIINNRLTNCESAEYKLVNVGMGDQGIRASFVYTLDTSNLKSGGYPVDMVGVSSPPRPAKFSWDFGDMKKAGGLSTTSRVRHIYALAGTYIPCYIVEDPQTGETDEYCQIINVGSNSVNNLLSGILLFDNNPNPFSEYTRISYSTSESMYIELVVLDNLGREISTLIKTTKQAGSYEYLWDTSDLTEGVYYLRLSTSKGWTKTRMVVKK